MFPALSAVRAFAGSDRTAKLPKDQQELRCLAFAALRELLVRLSVVRPLLLYIDDIQWGDSDSAEALFYS